MDRNLDFFLTSHVEFLFIFEQYVDNCKQNLFREGKVGFTERPRSLNPRKAKAMAFFPVVLLFNARSRCVT